jgi:hypothetical protein
MDTLRVSVTDLDQLRYYRDDENNMELAELIARLKHLMPSSEAMEAGTALHKALEMAEPGEFKGLAADGFTFSFDADAEIELAPIREIKAERDYLIDDCAVTLVGKVDAINGRHVADHKFTARFDPDRYLDSMQWRAYLDMFDADAFQWNIFEALESAPKNYLVRNVHKLTMHRYPGMGQDVERELHEFVRFARHHLTDRFIPQASMDMARRLAAG